MVPTVVPLVQVGEHEGLVDIGTAAAFLRVPRSWLYTQSSSPTSGLPVYRLGRHLRFRVSELLQWAKRKDGAGVVTP